MLTHSLLPKRSAGSVDTFAVVRIAALKRAVGQDVNEQFLEVQLERSVPRIDYVLPDGFNNVDQVALVHRECFSATQLNFLDLTPRVRLRTRR